MEKFKELRTRYTKSAKRKVAFEKQAFLDDLVNEAIEEPYQFNSIDEAVSYLSRKYKLNVDELAYVKKSAESKKISFIEKFRNRK